LDAIIGTVGLVLRFPVFVVWLVASGVFWIVLSIYAATWWLVLVPLVWLMIGVPLAFFGTAFGAGSSKQLKDRLTRHIQDWHGSRRKYLTNRRREIRRQVKWLSSGSSY
jgi:hypothetical protein